MDSASTAIEAARQILGVVVLGPVCVVLALAVYTLFKRLDKIQEQRVADAQADRSQALQVLERCVTALQGASAALESFRETMQEMKGLLSELARGQKR